MNGCCTIECIRAGQYTARKVIQRYQIYPKVKKESLRAELAMAGDVSESMKNWDLKQITVCMEMSNRIDPKRSVASNYVGEKLILVKMSIVQNIVFSSQDILRWPSIPKLAITSLVARSNANSKK